MCCRVVQKIKYPTKTKAPPKFFTFCTRTTVVKFQNDTATIKLCSITPHNLTLVLFVRCTSKIKPCHKSGVEWRVVDRKLLFETDNEKFHLRRVKSKKICRHLGGNLFQSSLEVGDTWIESYKDGTRKKLSIICVNWWFGESEKIRVLSGVVYMTKSRGPRTEPWGAPQEEICSEEKSL